MTRGFEPVCTNDEARDYFKKCGLTYNDITEGDILSLVLMINRELKKSNKVGETSVNTMSLSKKIDMTKNTNGTIKNCYLYLNSHYFTRREAISFNTDGFVGFAGWADDGNLNPLKRAFLSWCDELKAESNEAYKMAIKALDQRWIPVSERLPEESGYYLVTTTWKGSYSGDVYIETNMAVYREKQKEWDCVDVIAWMPIPEPYKEGEHDRKG